MVCEKKGRGVLKVSCLQNISSEKRRVSFDGGKVRWKFSALCYDLRNCLFVKVSFSCLDEKKKIISLTTTSTIPSPPKFGYLPPTLFINHSVRFDVNSKLIERNKIFLEAEPHRGTNSELKTRHKQPIQKQTPTDHFIDQFRSW